MHREPPTAPGTTNVERSLAAPLSTPRLVLRGWQLEDAPAALEIYGHPDVARWLSPAMDRVADLAQMRRLLGQWIAQDAASVRPAGRWVIQQRVGDRVIGGVFLLPLPPADQDLQIGWQLHPDVWGQGYATETTHADGRLGVHPAGRRGIRRGRTGKHPGGSHRFAKRRAGARIAAIDLMVAVLSAGRR